MPAKKNNSLHMPGCRASLHNLAGGYHQAALGVSMPRVCMLFCAQFWPLYRGVQRTTYTGAHTSRVIWLPGLTALLMGCGLARIWEYGLPLDKILGKGSDAVYLFSGAFQHHWAGELAASSGQNLSHLASSIVRAGLNRTGLLSIRAVHACCHADARLLKKWSEVKCKAVAVFPHQTQMKLQK